jgi:hypothetical protein
MGEAEQWPAVRAEPLEPCLEADWIRVQAWEELAQPSPGRLPAIGHGGFPDNV